ncbi:hypothetical protein NDU88_001421 [Pleurodeles waltl]|uniref:Uncharacterized protein n=1 Tax=Pleurodeles waltl TaxID=8319 RepID=A0AAV7USR7_PLEWA|nr:hypothetical protein NDU88_001421 [Pleurodeles waltl]
MCSSVWIRLYSYVPHSPIKIIFKPDIDNIFQKYSGLWHFLKFFLQCHLKNLPCLIGVIQPLTGAVFRCLRTATTEHHGVPRGYAEEATPDVFPAGTVGKTFSQDDIYFRVHDLKRLTEPGTILEEERRQGGDAHQAATRVEILAAAAEEDTGPVAERPGIRGQEKRRGEHQESNAGAERSEDIYITGQPCHVPGGT